jgi:hypothetical protein
LEVAVFAEDVSERLLYDIVGRCVNEGGILINLQGGRIGQPD